MYIRQIILTNWKAYKSVDFKFPEPTETQNVVLIGARNGYGKTSLFQAILLGMYGKEGFDLIRRPPLSSGSGQHSSYQNFLKNVLHKNHDDGIKSCSVEITIVDDEGSPVEIRRTWHFNQSGEYRPQDDSVEILEGIKRKPIGPPNDREDRVAWYRNYVARVLLPSHLSSFFVFDGEKASIFADHDMAEQVKIGITGLLGIPIINDLADDLRSYASARRSQAPDVTDDTIDELENDRNKLKDRLSENESRLGTLEPQITKFKCERDELQQELAAFGSGSQTETRRQIEQVASIDSDIQKQTSELESLLANDIALALAGVGLRERLSTRLASESILDKWETGKQQGDSRIDAFIDALDLGVSEINPSVGETRRERIMEIARNAWDKLWYPPPLNCADEYHHPYLDESGRGNVRQHLQRLGEVSAPSVINLLDSIDADSGKLKRLRAEIAHLESVAPHLEKKRERLILLNSEIGNLDQEIGAIRRENQSLDAQIKIKNENLGGLYARRDKAKPVARKISRAIDVANMIDEIVLAAVPSQIEAIANAMTTAYKDMAHKQIVERIYIDDKCSVKLLDKTGIDVRNLDASAGEKQIFTQALISAVSSVWGRTFPMVIDTPLGRLDERHRRGVLQHLTKPNKQVILLSTDTEVVDDYLRVIESSIQKKYLINHDVSTGISTAMVGYFDNEEMK